MASITKKAKGHIGIKKNFVLKGMELNDRRMNGECIDDIISTTWARKTKSGTLSSVHSKHRKSERKKL